MLTSSVNTLDEAIRTVLEYGLDKRKWENGGSSIAFARWLFLAGGNLDIRQIAYHLADYKVACSDASDDGEMLDQSLLGGVEIYSGALEEVAQSRRRLATFIRNQKMTPSGERLWNTIATLATAPDLIRCQHELKRRDHLPRLAVALESLREFEGDFPDCSESDYTPGENEHVDHLLSRDIERLDRTLLEVPAWSGAVPESWREISALLRLANNFCLRSHSSK